LPFATEHIDAAAALLAQRHARDLKRDRRLPAKYVSVEGTRPLIEAMAGRSTGVAVFEGGRMVGYLLGTHDLDWGGRARLVPMEGHAVDHPDAVEVYREMYAAASPAWINGGFFQHTVNIPAGDDIAAAAFASFGFGQMLAFGLRDTSPLGGRAPEVRIERAGPEQVDAVARLMGALGRYNSQSPLYRPYVPNPEPEWPRKPQVLTQMEDPACSYWLAYEGEEPAGVMVSTPPDPAERMINPERSIYLWIAYVRPESRAGGVGRALVENGLAWARGQGYEFCTVGWFTTNLSGARFWTGRDYRPAMYRLERRLDERIIWAKAEG
jgi:GNAT superfamily N-acetyltransferase